MAKSKIVVSHYIKDPANKIWLEDHELEFMDWMSKHHSLFDICHTFLHLDTLDDEYVKNMRAHIEKYYEKKFIEEDAQKKAAGENVKKKRNRKSSISDPQVKISEQESKAEAIRKEVEQSKDSDLLD
jgi:hypothetical protein